MKNQDFNCVITVNTTPQETLEGILQVSKWWTTDYRDQTVIKFIHEGLVPEMECYFRCSEGWDIVIKERLFDYLTKGMEEG